LKISTYMITSIGLAVILMIMSVATFKAVVILYIYISVLVGINIYQAIYPEINFASIYKIDL
jgi:hypothetical protein